MSFHPTGDFILVGTEHPTSEFVDTNSLKSQNHLITIKYCSFALTEPRQFLLPRLLQRCDQYYRGAVNRSQ